MQMTEPPTLRSTQDPNHWLRVLYYQRNHIIVAQVQQVVLSTASNVDSVSKIREMAIVNPEERASAAQMLVKYFDGAGLSTPRNQVPVLNSILILLKSPIVTHISLI
ncbi:hypothetical protein BJ875DRAFT_466998 [Amylocarpus encephaloides]|uniref:Uncharacterized protein n=1 Tax=Amylocarpus encephaloides TaxID=45428 RepID=A0A9P8C3D9_9HELO|nr:hypothetical protein BJ875DRAFT_466998 [Amylocarpus encephaloides]